MCPGPGQRGEERGGRRRLWAPGSELCTWVMGLGRSGVRKPKAGVSASPGPVLWSSLTLN